MGWGTAVTRGVPTAAHDGATFTFKALQFIDTENGWGVALLLNAINQLPSQDQPFRDLNAGIVSRLEGWEVPAGRPNVRVQYAVVDAVLLVGSAWILWTLATLAGWGRDVERRLRAPEPAWRAAATAARLGLELLVPLGVLLAVPPLVGGPWSVLLMVSPDLGRWALAASALLLGAGVGHAALLARALRRRRTPAPSPSTVASASTP
jgi:hypothetical protein